MRRVMTLGLFRRLLVAYTLNELAWAVGTLALSYLVYQRTGSPLGAAAFFLCSLFIPALIAPAIVARIERWPSARVLPALYGGESVAFLLLGLVAPHFNLIAVLALALLDGLLAMSARPLTRAATVGVTSEAGLLREGNALMNTAFSLNFMLGPAIGGAIVAAGTIRAALFVNTGLFAAIALTLLTAAHLPASDVGGDVRGRLRAAADYARRHAPVRTMLAIQGASVLVFTVSVPVEVVLARHTLHAGARGYGALLAAWGAGAVVGSLVYARWRSASPRVLIAGGSGLIALGYAGMAAAPTLSVAIVAAAAAGIGNGFQSMAARTALQEVTDSGWMALVMSFSESLEQAAPGVGIVIGGVVATLAGPRAAFAVAAAGSLAVTAGTWMVLHPGRRFLAPATHGSRL